MKKLTLLALIIASVILFVRCGEEETEVLDEMNLEELTGTEGTDYPVIEETWLSKWNEADNVDSPAFYETPDGIATVIATAKEADILIVYNAETGDEIERIGSPGTGRLQFERPNGIWVIDNMAFVVERDNRRIQVLKLPEFEFMGFIAEDMLVKPYGISVHKEGGVYHMLVTDVHENADGSIAPDSLLAKGVLHYTLNIQNDKIESKFERYIGESDGPGVVKIVESIYADPDNNNLLIAEEWEENTHVKVYNLATGEFTGKTIGEGLFKYQAEGIALVDCGMGEGFWICTDQYTGDNTFHVFGRKSFTHLGSFKSKETQNTDGVWLTRKSFGPFQSGVLYAINNDGGVGALDLKTIMETLEISCE